MATTDSELARAGVAPGRRAAGARTLRPSPLAAALLSLLLPGLGQLAQGRRRRGAVLLAPAVAVAGLVLWAWLAGPLSVLTLLLREDVLLALLAANGVVFAARVFAVVDAWRPTGVRSRSLASTLPIALVLAALTAAPHVVAGYYDYRAYDLLTSVFTDEEPQDVLPLEPLAEPPPAPTSDAPAAGEPGPSPVKPAAPVAPGPASPTPGTVPAAPPAGEDLADAPPVSPGVDAGPPASDDDWLSDDVLLGDPLAGNGPAEGPLLDDGSPLGAEPLAAGVAAAGLRDRGSGWLTLLLLGGDAGPGRSGLRTDTMIVVAIQAGTGKAVAFGVPRNLTGVPLPGEAGRRYGTYDSDILNALYQWGNRNPSLFPGGRDPGATALKQSLSLLLGLQIRYYALVDLAGFVDIVDAVGGVDVTATERVQDKVSPPHPDESWIEIDVFPGERYHFDGRHALAYARSRWATSDYNRMQRQRCVLSAMADQLDVATILRSFPKVASVVKRSVSTDVPLRRLPDLVRLISAIDAGRSSSVSFITPTYTAGADEKSKGFLPDLALIRATVRRLVLEPAGSVRGTNGIETLRAACG